MDCPICGSDDVEILNSKQKTYTTFNFKIKLFSYRKNLLK